jgi:hypothetical protein
MSEIVSDQYRHFVTLLQLLYTGGVKVALFVSIPYKEAVYLVMYREKMDKMLAM